MTFVQNKRKPTFLCVNVSNPNLPWYPPIPLWPTPPKGSCSTLPYVIIGSSFEYFLSRPSFKMVIILQFDNFFWIHCFDVHHLTFWIWHIFGQVSTNISGLREVHECVLDKESIIWNLWCKIFFFTDKQTNCIYKEIFCSREVHECVVDKESPAASASLEQLVDLERFPSLTLSPDGIIFSPPDFLRRHKEPAAFLPCICTIGQMSNWRHM